jgi:hypothetical protein
MEFQFLNSTGVLADLPAVKVGAGSVKRDVCRVFGRFRVRMDERGCAGGCGLRASAKEQGAERADAAVVHQPGGPGNIQPPNRPEEEAIVSPGGRAQPVDGLESTEEGFGGAGANGEWSARAEAAVVGHAGASDAFSGRPNPSDRRLL